MPGNVKRGFCRYCSTACYHKSRERPQAEKFWEKVQKSEGCWLWTGACKNNSKWPYGVLGNGRGRNTLLAHRVSWELHYGPIPEGMLVLHHCDVAPCVRPDHLFLGTFKDNTQDMLKKGRFTPCKLTEQEVLEIRRRYPAGGVTYKELAQQYNVSHQLISFILSRRIWKHI